MFPVRFVKSANCHNRGRKIPFEPAYEIMVPIVLRKLILQTRMRSHPGAICLIFGRTLRLLPCCMCANSEGSGETARMRRLA